MKINRNKGNLQSELQKMLDAGRENVEKDEKKQLHAMEQSSSPSQSIAAPEHVAASAAAEKPVAAPKRQSQKTTSKMSQEAASKTSRDAAPKTSQEVTEPQRPNASQRHEVPDHNVKYAGEPIKSVGCRMPQSLYARMLQYKALNDSQINRITLNDIIIEAVEKYMDER